MFDNTGLIILTLAISRKMIRLIHTIYIRIVRKRRHTNNTIDDIKVLTFYLPIYPIKYSRLNI